MGASDMRALSRVPLPLTRATKLFARQARQQLRQDFGHFSSKRRARPRPPAFGAVKHDRTLRSRRVQQTL
jgi:hypothetical protein